MTALQKLEIRAAEIRARLSAIAGGVGIDRRNAV